jgi:hypothetical protein
LTYQQIGTNADGTPQYQSTQSYSPEQQQLYQGQTAVSNALTGTAQNAIADVNNAYSTPYNTSNIPGLQYGASGGAINNSYNSGGNIQSGLDYSSLGALPTGTDFQAQNKTAQDAAYAQATSRLDPQFALQQQQLASTLAAKGVTENSAAYNQAMQQFGMTKNDAYNQANLSAVQTGNAEQAQLFGMNMSARQEGANELQSAGTFANSAQAQQNQQNQAAAAYGNTAQQQAYNQASANAALNNTARGDAITEYNQQRNEPINRIAALLGTGGGVTNPTFADYSKVSSAPVDYSGLVSSNYAQANQNYQTQLASQNSLLGSVFGAIGGIGGGLATKFSDRRLKHDIIPVGNLANGIKTYAYSYLGSDTRYFGVIADEVMQIMPEAIVANDNGYMMVDYRKVYYG